jgi:tetratricopeptide (TPR) repeat protein/predicted Ser/Thr protein kinase
MGECARVAAEDAATLDPGDADAARYRRLCAAFDRLHPLEGVARVEELDRLRGSDADLVDELLDMLAASDRPGLRVEQGLGAEALPTDLGDERGYRVLRELGRGGMGRVLLAERSDGRFTRQVAIKVIDRSLADADWRRRFAAEREILARLMHPQIVRLLDAGESAAGVPYLVMEYVDGEPLDRYLRSRQAPLEERLKLFERIAAAVSYAHQMLVAHRDIKPANILVDSSGMPHLLDFGIARLLSEQAATATAARALTPRYAAPEQVAGTPSTAALDVYQLGVLLFEMLAGEPPFAQLDGPALLRAVLEQDPPSPDRVARERGVFDARRIDADLSAICLRALRKEPTQRYASVDALLADLERWHNGEPVRASDGGWWYRGRKFVRRHWRALGVTVLVLGLSAVFVWRLDRELERSEREREVAEQATELIVDVIGQADPSRAQGAELTLSEALDQSVERIRAIAGLPPLVLARVLEAVGATYVELSKPNQAIPLLGEAADAFRRADDLEGQLRAQHAQAIAMQDLGNYPQAQAALEAVLATRTAAGLGGDAFDAELHSSLANLHQYQRRRPEALAEFDQALAILRAMSQPDQAQLAHTLRNLGDIRTAQGDVDGGLAALIEAQQLTQKLYGPDHPDSIRLLRMLGRNAQRRGAYDEALIHFEQGWERAQRVFEAPHGVRALLAHPLAMAYLHRGDVAAAERVMRQAASEGAALYPPQHPNRATLQSDLALILLAADKHDEARELAGSARDLRRDLEVEDAAIAEPELVLAVLDCLSQPGATARAAVDAALDRVRADVALSPATLEDFSAAAVRCKPD